MIREWLKRSNDKAKLRSCFRAAELIRTRKVHKNQYEIFPLIHSINYNNPDYTEITFTLPNGIDPKTITKKEYVFKQFFGRQIEIKGDLKKFVLRVYKRGSIGFVKYNFQKYVQFAKNEKGEKFKLPILCGDDVTTGKPILFDMVTHPHILNGGETGGGKSTWLRAVLTFLIQYLSPEDLHLYLCDLKAVEFILFRNVKHVKAIQTEPEGVITVLESLNDELDKRQALMLKHEVTHVDKLPERLPYIVCFIDEFQDLRGNDTAMDKLMRIGAKGRALGVFLVLTTQRPSAAIVKGDIKANLTVSMAFKVKNKINSNMILDAGAPNAAKLKGNGHGIVSIGDYYEIQSPLLEEDDARRILKNYKVFNPKGEDITELVKVEEIKEPDELDEEGPLG